jgi:hypothetical protein
MNEVRPKVKVKVKVNYGRIPEVLANEIEDALIPLSHLSPWETMRLLKRYRKNRVEAIAKGGIYGADFKGISQGFYDMRVFSDIENLDKVYQKLHSFRSPGGARQYNSNAQRDLVLDDRQSVLGALGGRPPADEATPEQIGQWLRNRAYTGSNNKKELVLSAMDHFKVKKTKVTDAITAFGLSKKIRSLKAGQSQPKKPIPR